jgi:hypothetical protein
MLEQLPYIPVDNFVDKVVAISIDLNGISYLDFLKVSKK